MLTNDSQVLPEPKSIAFPSERSTVPVLTGRLPPLSTMSDTQSRPSRGPDEEVELPSVRAAPAAPDILSAGGSRSVIIAGAGQGPHFRFFKQVWLLLKKNWLMQTRSVSMLATQLLIGVIFLAILNAMQLAIENNPFFALDFYAVRDPVAKEVVAPMECQPHAWFPGGVKKPQCFSFVIAPNTSDYMGSFTRNVAQEMAGEAGFNGEGENRGWMSLGSEMEVDEWLYSNQNATPVAVIFKSDGIGGNDVSYTLQYNHTRICNVISALDCTDPKHDIMASFQRLVDQSVLRVKRFQEKDGRRDASIDVKFSDFPHPAGVLDWDVMEAYGADWLYIAVIFNMVVQMYFIVTEKEKKLRGAMSQMGMMRSAYWMSWFISCEVVNVFVVLCMCAFGWAVNLEFFRENGFEVFFLLFMLTTTSFTMLAFFFSTLLGTGEHAFYAGIGWFVLTFLATPILVAIYFYNGAENREDIIKGLSLISSAPFYKGVNDLVRASSGGKNKGMEWDQENKPTQTAPDIGFALEGWQNNGAWYTMEHAYEYLGWCCVLYAVLTWYFDHVVPNQYGLAHSPIFFLNWRYWANVPTPTAPRAAIEDEEDDRGDIDDDVLAEEQTVHSGEYGERKPAIIVSGLKKKFESRVYGWLASSSWAGSFVYGSFIGIIAALATQDPFSYFFWLILTMIFLRSKCCCGCLNFRLRILPTRRFQSFTAVKGVSYAIEENSLFVLLGHNGAGKSTTFNMMTGLMPLTGGDATIMGMSVRDDMEKISVIMGYCPQHDVLWDELSGREHLQLFARLKNIPEVNIPAEVEARLKDVKLEKSADVLSGNYSGGMQRRLSLAIALLGDPKVIFLDGRQKYSQ